MESKLYACPRCGKDINSTSDLTSHVNTCKIPITLPSCQPSKLTAVLEDNTTHHSNLPSDKNKEGISPGASNRSEKRIRPADNDNEDIRPVDID